MAATEEKIENKEYYLPESRLSFVKIHDPEKEPKKDRDGKPVLDENGQPVFNLIYSATGLIPYSAEMVEKLLAPARLFWLAKDPQAKLNTDKTWFAGVRKPIGLPGDDTKSSLRDENEGMIRVPMRAYNNAPQVCRDDPERSFITVADKKEFYSGCWAIIMYRMYAYEWNGTVGVSFSPKAFLKTRDDSPFAAGPVDVVKAFGHIPPTLPSRNDANANMFPADELPSLEGV